MKKKIFLYILMWFLIFAVVETFFILWYANKEKEKNIVSSTSVKTEASLTISKDLPKEEIPDTKEQLPEVEEKLPSDDKNEENVPQEEDLEEAKTEDTEKAAISGKLSVSGRNLVDETGNTVQLKGLSTHGIAWFPDYINKNLFTELKEAWNCNVVRLAMYTAEYGGFCSGGDKNNLYKLIDNGVTYASELGMYVIIDWHILSDNNPNTNKSDALEFFKAVSKKYADNPYVIYELCNEPNGNTSWKDITSYALELIPEIRKNSPDSVIIVGTPRWSQEVDKAAADPITEYDNIMYTLHFYADTHRDDLRNTLENALKKDLPVFVTEYGICDASGGGAINTSEAEKWMALLDKYQVSSCAWNISNKSETSAIFKSSVNKKYGFTESDLSDSGKWLLKMLTGKTAYNTEDIKYEESSVPDREASGNNSDNNTSHNQKDIAGVAGPVSITLSAGNSWESEGKTFTQYTVTVTNNNSYDITSWSGEVVFDTPIELSQGWCAEYSVSGNILKISNADFNGNLKAGESTKDIGCIIAQ